MKNKITLVLSGLVLLSMTSCIKDFIFEKGNGLIETELRRTGEFNKIDNATSSNIIYRRADSTSVSVTADQNLLDHLVTEVCNNRLEIRTRPLGIILDYSQRPVIIVTSPRIGEANLSGSGSLNAYDMSGHTVSVRVSGSGNITVDSISCTDLSAMVSGSGDIEIKSVICTNSDLLTSGSGVISLSGKCENENAKISGSGKIDGSGFTTNSATISISGSGDVYSRVSDYLKASISGSGDIFLFGNPRIDQKRSGSGRIRKQ